MAVTSINCKKTQNELRAAQSPNSSLEDGLGIRGA